MNNFSLSENKFFWLQEVTSFKCHFKMQIGSSLLTSHYSKPLYTYSTAWKTLSKEGTCHIVKTGSLSCEKQASPLLKAAHKDMSSYRMETSFHSHQVRINMRINL